MIYYHYLKKCKEQQLHGVTNVTSWIDCVCQLLLKKNEKLKGDYLFVRCNEFDDKMNIIPDETSIYLCRFNRKQYYVKACYENLKFSQPFPVSIRNAKFERAFMFGESSNLAICQKTLEYTCHVRTYQTLSLENMTTTFVESGRSAHSQNRFSHFTINRTRLLLIVTAIVLVISFIRLVSRFSQTRVVPTKNFPEIEGVYYISGVDNQEGSAAEIVRSPKGQDLFYLYILSEYSTPQIEFFYNQEIGVIKSDELGDGKVFANEKEKTICIQFKEWTLSK